MKKRHKVLGTTLLTASLLLAACGKDKSSASAPDYELENVEFPVEEDVSLKMITNNSPLAPSDPNEKLIFERLEEETGVHIDWINYVDDFAEQRNLEIVSGDLPDAIWN